MKTKIFSVATGSCASTIGAQPQNYSRIYNECAHEFIQNETISPNDGGNKPRNLISDLVGIGITTGSKLVLVKSQQGVDGTYGYMGFDLPNMLDGQSRDVGFNIVPGQATTFVQTSVFTRNTKGIWQSERRAQVIKGSELSIFQPDYVIWTDDEQIYPFVFISDSDWTVDVCLEVPTGYQVIAPGTCTQSFVNNEIKVVEFKVSDIGSPKNFDVKAKFTATHKGKKTNVEGNIHSFNKKGKN